MVKKFDEIVKEKFDFLISNYNFKQIENKKESWGYCILYINNTTAVKIIYEYREAYIFITLCRLEKGRVIKNPAPVVKGSKLHCFGLDDIISIRNPEAKMKPTYKYDDDEPPFDDKQNGFAVYTAKFADNLREYASDVMSGNFEIFKQLDKIVKKRAEKFNNEK